MLLAPIILLWSFSGLVMMYVPFPQLSPQERISLLPEIRSVECCSAFFYEQILPLDVSSVAIERLNNDTVIKVTDTSRQTTLFSLNRQQRLVDIDIQQASKIAQTATNLSINNIELIDTDQWTIYSTFNPLRPLYKVSFTDDEGMQLYVSSKTGEIIQQTTAFQRQWNWVGTVSHWLYFTDLRQHTQIWFWLVVGLALASLALVISGTWMGIQSLLNSKAGASLPYSGVSWLHYWGGVTLSALLFSFLFSGVVAMNPWGLLNYKQINTHEAIGKNLERSDVINSLQQVSEFIEQQRGILNLTMTPWNNKPYWFVSYVNSTDSKSDAVKPFDKGPHLERFNQNFVRSDIPLHELQRVGERLATNQGLKQTLMHTEDRYYYAFKKPVELPIWKLF